MDTWLPMRRQERGDVGGGISAQVEKLRMDASSKGRTWLQEKLASMTRDDLRKVAAASGVGNAWARWFKGGTG